MPGIALVVMTALPLLPSNEWWIRIFDFPRAQIAVAIVVLLVLLGVGRAWRTEGGLLLMAALLLSLAYQALRILPYTPLHPVELAGRAACPADDRLRYFLANVLYSNREVARLLAAVQTERPDVVLLTETSPWWEAQVAPLARDLPHQVSIPQDNGYGMMLLSRLPLRDGEVRYLVEPDVPSIRATLRLPSGRSITLHGLHPRPPRPGQDTAGRDAELVIVGREVRRSGEPTIVAGDMNDVAWSDTTRLFQKVSGLLDPRVGRTLLPTFPAAMPWLRWPLDYVFVSPGFALLELRRLPSIGSDHLPIVVDLCASALAGAQPEAPALSPDARERARDIIREGREEAAEP